MNESMDIGARRPGRPRQFDQGAVLDAAVSLFWRDGYRDTSTRTLESALGISQSSIYNAFGSKRQLLEAALDRYGAAAATALAAPLESSQQGLESLDRFLVSLGEWQARSPGDGCLMVNTMIEDTGDMPTISQRTQAFRQRVHAALRSGFERAAALGEIEASNVDAYARSLLSMVFGLNVSTRGACGQDASAMLESVRAGVRAWRKP